MKIRYFKEKWEVRNKEKNIGEKRNMERMVSSMIVEQRRHR